MRIKKAPFKRRCLLLERQLLCPSDYVKREAMQSIADEIGYNDPIETLFEHIMGRVSTDISTLRMNHPRNVTYRVSMSYADRTVEPKYGYLYPNFCVVYVAGGVFTAVLVAYVRLSKQVGRFV